jgi:hypothetical protein
VELGEGHHQLFTWDEKKLTGHDALKPSQFIVRVEDTLGNVWWSHGPLARLWKLRRLR